jgi:hypothetical protein
LPGSEENLVNEVIISR